MYSKAGEFFLRIASSSSLIIRSLQVSSLPLLQHARARIAASSASIAFSIGVSVNPVEANASRYVPLLIFLPFLFLIASLF
jgi:hypothetical protein